MYSTLSDADSGGIKKSAREQVASVSVPQSVGGVSPSSQIDRCDLLHAFGLERWAAVLLVRPRRETSVPRNIHLHPLCIVWTLTVVPPVQRRFTL